MNRRTFLGSLAGASATAVGAGYMATESASATMATQANLTKLAAESDSGTVKDIHISGSGEVMWEHFAPTRILTRMYVDSPEEDGQWKKLDQAEYTDLGEDLIFNALDAMLIQSTHWDTELFSASEDGETVTRQFTVMIRVTLFDGNGNTIDKTQEHPVRTKVTNLKNEPEITVNSAVDGDIRMATETASE